MSTAKARITRMAPSWLECYGGRRHDFVYRGAVVRTETRDGVRVEVVEQICQRCPKQRVAVYRKSDLATVSVTYTRVRGYDAEPGEGRLEPADVRRELIRRARKDDWA